MQLQDATILETPTPFENWLVATLSITHDDAVAVLSHPHYIETDTYRTAGGAEDHWAFQFPCGTKVGIVLGVPYDHVHVYADPPNTDDVIRYLQPLIAGRELHICDPPMLVR